MKSKPADKIQDLQFFGEFGGVNPSISDSSTYTFLSAKSMSETFEGNTDGCYLYSRNSYEPNTNPSTNACMYPDLDRLNEEPSTLKLVSLSLLAWRIIFEAIARKLSAVNLVLSPRPSTAILLILLFP